MDKPVWIELFLSGLKQLTDNADRYIYFRIYMLLDYTDYRVLN